MWRPDKNDADALASSLDAEDVFTLYIAAIGHDVGHPGFTNVFMVRASYYIFVQRYLNAHILQKNAKTPLSTIYNDKSALEQMHLALLLRVMRHHGLGHLLDRPDSGPSLRKLLLSTVLATDMSVHNAFMSRLKAFVDGEDISLEQRKILICQAMIKCADISNPVSIVVFHFVQG
jgi:3'5'-cyclic nucleotide phosphodiesterase